MKVSQLPSNVTKTYLTAVCDAGVDHMFSQFATITIQGVRWGAVETAVRNMSSTVRVAGSFV